MRSLLPLLLAGAACCAATAAEQEAVVDAPLLNKPQAELLREAQALIAPRPVQLKQRMRLGDAVSALSASGNPTMLALRVDAGREAEIAQDGDGYWQAVAALCKAFALTPVPGCHLQRQGSASPAATLQMGMVVLEDAGPHRALVLPCGPLALILDDCRVRRCQGEGKPVTIGLSGFLRLEPHLDATAISLCQLRPDAVVDQHGRTLVSAVELDAGPIRMTPPDALVLSFAVDNEPSELGIRGQLRIGVCAPWRITAPIGVGQSMAIPCAGQILSLAANDASHTQFVRRGFEQLSLTFLSDTMPSLPVLQLSKAGAIMPNPPFGMLSQSSPGSSRVLWNFDSANAPDAAIITGEMQLGDPLTLPFDARVPLSELAEGDGPISPTLSQVAPTRIAWPAGHMSLHQALAALGHPGALVLQLGVDESALHDLPAFSGTYWEGVLALCRAFGLTLIQGDPEAEAAGRPDLRPTRIPADDRLILAARAGALDACASGPFLVLQDAARLCDTRALGDGRRQMLTRIRLRPEPGFPSDAILQATIVLDTLGHDQNGHLASVTRSALGRNGSLEQIMGPAFAGRFLLVNGQLETPVVIDGLRPDSRSMAVSGNVRLVIGERTTRQATLLPDVPTRIGADYESFQATLMMGNPRPGGAARTGVSLQGMRRPRPEDLLLVAPSGAVLTCTELDSQTQLFAFPVTERGAHTLLVDTVINPTEVQIPFSCDLAVPAVP